MWPLPAKQALLWTIHVPHYSGNVVAQCKSTRLLTHRSQVRICLHSHWKPLESVAKNISEWRGGLFLVQHKDKDRRGKGRRCCLGGRICSICCRATYFALDYSELWRIYDEFILFYKSSWCNSSFSPKTSYYKIANAARNWINSVPQIVGTTFACSSVFIILLWVHCSKLPLIQRLFLRVYSMWGEDGKESATITPLFGATMPGLL